MGKKIICFSTFILISVCFSTVTFAEEPSSETKDWEWNLAPFYLWAISIDGDQTVGSDTSDIEVNFDDLFNKLDAAFIVNFQGVYQNRWGFMLDYNYMNLSDDTSLGAITQNVDVKIQLLQLDGFYRLNHEEHKFDLRLGLRGVSMDTEVKLQPTAIQADQKEDWVDPIVGVRWGWHFADKWRLNLSGDIGGFGVGSDITWQAVGIIDWQPFKYVSFIAGYRALYFDYKDGDAGSPDYFNLNATMHGPILGINFRW